MCYTYYNRKLTYAAKRFGSNRLIGERMDGDMLDKTDLEIIALLKENAKLQLRDIGERVHLTGQAVSNRIAKLEDLGVIQCYTVALDETKLGNTLSAYITVFMKTTAHGAFQTFLKESPAVTEANRISGDGCYLIKVALPGQEALNQFLDQILAFGNYRVNVCIGQVK